MSGFDLLDLMQSEPDARDMPVVVFTGKDLSAGRGGAAAVGGQERRRSRTCGRRSGCSTRPRSSCIASSSDLPETKRQHARSGCTARTTSLRDRRVLVVDDDARNIFALTTPARESRHGGRRARRTAARRSSILQQRDDLSVVLMDIMMPEMDGYETMRRDPARAAVPDAADSGAHGQGDEGRPREVPRRRRVGLHRQAGQHRSAAVAAARLAAPLSVMTMDMTGRRIAAPPPGRRVDRRRRRRRRARSWSSTISRATSTRSRRCSSQSGCQLVRAQSADEALLALLEQDFAAIVLDIRMPGMSGLELADADQGAAAHAARADPLPHGAHVRRARRPARLRRGRGRLPHQADPRRDPAVEDRGVRRAVPQDARAGAGQRGAAARGRRARARRGGAAARRTTTSSARARAHRGAASARTGARTSSSRRSPTSCAIRSRRSGRRSRCCGCRAASDADRGAGARRDRPAGRSDDAAHRRSARRQPHHERQARAAARPGRALATSSTRPSRPAGRSIAERRHTLSVSSCRSCRSTLDADPARLAQVLSNLLTNAAKYTPPGGDIALIDGRSSNRQRDDSRARQRRRHRPGDAAARLRAVRAGRPRVAASATAGSASA